MESQCEEFDTMCTRTCEPHHQTSHNGNTPSHTIDLLNCNTDPKKMPSQRYCLAGAIIPCESQLHLVTSTIPKMHTKSQTTISKWFQLDHPQHGETHNKHIPDNHSTITPFTRNRSRHVWIKSDGTHHWNQKPSLPATTTSKLANLDFCTPRETQSRTIQELTRTAAMISEFRAHEKMLASRNVQCTHTLRNGIGGGRGTTSRHAQRHVVQSQQKWPHVHSTITHNTHMNHQNSGRNNPSNKLSDRTSSHADCHLTSDIQTKATCGHKTVCSWNYVLHQTPIPKQIMVAVKECYKNCAHHDKNWDWALSVNITRENKKMMNAQTSHVERALNTSKSDWLGAELSLHRVCSRIKSFWQTHW